MTQERTIAAAKMRRRVTEQAVTREQYPISRYLSALKFRPRLWGVDEAEVWRAMERLCQLYEDALTTERARRQQAEACLKPEEGNPDG